MSEKETVRIELDEARIEPNAGVQKLVEELEGQYDIGTLFTDHFLVECPPDKIWSESQKLIEDLEGLGLDVYPSHRKYTKLNQSNAVCVDGTFQPARGITSIVVTYVSENLILPADHTKIEFD